MIAVLVFGLLAAAEAAPQRFPPGPPPPERHFGHYDPFAGDMFDTRQFWQQMVNELKQMDEMLASFSRRFPTTVSQCGIEGNEFKISIPLNGFDEKDIVVKAKEGFLMVQAVHKVEEGMERIYLDAKTLPTNVNVTGTWTFADGVLKIIFPLKDEATTEAPVDETTRTIIKDREEVEEHTEEDKDVNVEVGLRGDQETKENAEKLFTNEIPRKGVEATTYAVDLKDEVEFVPIRY